MPYMRQGLPRADQYKCANLLEEGVKPKEVAKLLHTTVEVVQKFDKKALDKWNEKAKVKEKEAAKKAAADKDLSDSLLKAAKAAKAAKEGAPWEGDIGENNPK